MSFHLGAQPLVYGHAPAFHAGNGPWQQYHSAYTYSQGPAVVPMKEQGAAAGTPGTQQQQQQQQQQRDEADADEKDAFVASPVGNRVSLNASGAVESVSREPSIELGEDGGEARDIRAYLGEQRLAGLTVLSRRMWECRELVGEIRSILTESQAAVARVAPRKAMHA